MKQCITYNEVDYKSSTKMKMGKSANNIKNIIEKGAINYKNNL